MSGPLARMVPVAQYVPAKAEIDPGQELLLSNSLREAADVLEIDSIFHITSLYRYRRMRAAAERSGREAMRAYTSSDFLAIAKPSDIMVVIGYNISAGQARALSRESSIRYVQAAMRIGGQTDIGYFVAEAVHPGVADGVS